MLVQLLAGAAVAAIAAPAAASSVIDLSSQNWTLSSNNVTVAGHVPSHAHLDLLAAGVIGEPLYGTNDTELLWVQRLNWTYSTSLGDLYVQPRVCHIFSPVSFLFASG
jgi:beta-mannosidase